MNIYLIKTEHVKKVWSAFKCHTLGDYHDLYLKVDCLLLADVFEHFRRISTDDFGLDPVHYFTLHMYAWVCGFKIHKSMSQASY